MCVNLARIEVSDPSPTEFRETVRSHTEIVSLIGESIALEARSGGREYVGLCPFHDDRNPSLRVYPDRQTFRCWSCQQGGDVFTFLMEREKVSFPEALEILAKRANLEMPRKLARYTPSEESNRAQMFEVLQWAENQFREALLKSPAGRPALDYLRERGISDEMIQTFRLGFHPDDWTWLADRAQGKYPSKLLLDTRLVGERNGRCFDYFKNRVLFPIHNERGQAVSFGGRILPGSQDDAKYFNGLESQIFHKSRLLYAIDKARDGIRATETAVIVEGYTDCIACHQAGVTNVVATLGTALTPQHVTAIKRFARKVVLLFDGDEAGQRAALKAVAEFLAQDVDLRVLILPDNLDPADYLSQRGEAAFKGAIETAIEGWNYCFQTVIQRYGVTTIDGRQRVLTDMLRLLARVPNLATSVRESFLVANLAQRLSVTERVVREQLKEIREHGKRHYREEKAPPETRSYTEIVNRILSSRVSTQDRMECDLLEFLLVAPQLITHVPADFATQYLKNEVFRLLLTCCQGLAKSGKFDLAALLGFVEDRDLTRLIVWIDEQARAKGVDRKIAESTPPTGECPLLFQRSLENLQRLVQDREQRNQAVQLSNLPTGQAVLDDAIAEQLRQFQEYHKQAAARESPRLTTGPS